MTGQEMKLRTRLYAMEHVLTNTMAILYYAGLPESRSSRDTRRHSKDFRKRPYLAQTPRKRICGWMSFSKRWHRSNLKRYSRGKRSVERIKSAASTAWAEGENE